jgi:hypothetical protein
VDEAPSKLRRCWSFSLRILLVVVALLGSSFAWFGYCAQWMRARGDFCTLNEDIVGDPRIWNPSTPAPWPLNWAGEIGFHKISLSNPRSRDEAKRLFPESIFEVDP